MNKKPLIVFAITFIFLVPSLSGILFLPESNNLKEPTRDNIISAEAWLDGLEFRKSHNITGSGGMGAGGAGTDYQILIKVTRATGSDTGNNVFVGTNCKTDFGDIRFTDDDKTTELDYWLETNTSTYGMFWVEVADDLGVDRNIYIYYGNASVSTTSNGDNTFLFYEDWTTETVRTAVWDIQYSDGAVTFDDTDAVHGSVASVEANAGTDAYTLESDLHLANPSTPFAIRFRSEIESTVDASQRTGQGSGTVWDSAEPAAFMFSNEGSETFFLQDDDTNQDNQVMTDAYYDSYFIYDILRNSTTGTLNVDGVQRETGSIDPNTDSSNVALIYVRDSEYQVYSDWIIARNYITVEPASFSWGNEEGGPEEPHWQSFTMEDIIFYIPINQANVSLLLMLGGLVMIPTSTVLLVHGGRSELSRDKLFLFFLMFLFGWSLFLGGIL